MTNRHPAEPTALPADDERATPPVDPLGQGTTPEWDAYVAAQPGPVANLHVAPPADVLPLPDGREVTVDELVQVLRDQTSRPSTAAPDLPLRNNEQGAAWVAAAWRHTVHRQVRAVLALLDAGFGTEAQANARAALEHAIELVRLAAAADAVGLEPFMAAIAADAQTRQRKQLRRLAEIDEANGGAHRALLEHALSAVPAPPPAAGPRTVKDKFAAAVPTGMLFHDVYGRLSEAVHAGLTSATPYLMRTLRHGGPLPARPEAPHWAETLAVLAWSCWAADDALGRFVEDDGRGSHVRHEPADELIAAKAHQRV